MSHSEKILNSLSKHGKVTQVFTLDDIPKTDYIYTVINGNNVMQAAGISTDAVSTGGGRVANNDSEIWDGTSWATGPTNANSRYSPSDAVDCNGTFASVFFAGGTGSGNGTGTSVVVHFDR